MNNNRMVVDHLKAALLTTSEKRPFLAYLIQMTLVECATGPQAFGFNTNLPNKRDEEHSDACEALEILSQLPLPSTRTGMN